MSGLSVSMNLIKYLSLSQVVLLMKNRLLFDYNLTKQLCAIMSKHF